MTQKTLELESVIKSFARKSKFQKGLIIGIMLNENLVDKILTKLKKEEEQNNE